MFVEIFMSSLSGVHVVPDALFPAGETNDLEKLVAAGYAEESRLAAEPRPWHLFFTIVARHKFAAHKSNRQLVGQDPMGIDH